MEHCVICVAAAEFVARLEKGAVFVAHLICTWPRPIVCPIPVSSFFPLYYYPSLLSTLGARPELACILTLILILCVVLPSRNRRRFRFMF